MVWTMLDVEMDSYFKERNALENILALLDLHPEWIEQDPELGVQLSKYRQAKEDTRQPLARHAEQSALIVSSTRDNSTLSQRPATG